MRTQSHLVKIVHSSSKAWQTVRWNWHRSLEGCLIAVAIIVLFHLGAWRPLEHFSYNALYHLRGPIPWSDQVVVVEIDEDSLQLLGRFPWSRQHYIDLLHVLTKAQPSTVVLDILLSETTPQDEQLSEAMAEQGRVVLAQSWDDEGKPLLPAAPLRSAAIATGHVYKQEDTDGLARFVVPQMQGVAALGVVAVQVHALLHHPVPLPPDNQLLWINWTGPAKNAEHYSFADVIQGRIPAEKFRHKIVLVGVTAATLDSLQTPYDRNPPSSGVYLQATVISNLLQQNSLDRHWGNLLFLLLLVGSGLSWFLPQLALERQLLTWIGLCLLWGLLSLLLFHIHQWVPVATPMVLISLTGGVVALQEYVRTNARLKQSEERYAVAVLGSNEGLWDWDLRTDTIYFSPRWKELLGCQALDLADRPTNWFDRVHPDDLESLKLAIDAHRQGLSSHLEHEHRMLHQDGSYRWMICRGMAMRDKEGRAYRMAGSQTDITERRRVEDQLRRIALFDDLTDLPNRAYFMEHLKQAIAQSQRIPLYTYALLLLDLDRFQVVNSSLGNAIGDQLLIAAAHRLKGYLPPEAVIARLGGDEFAILLSPVENVSDAIRFADQIQRLLSLPFNLEGHEVFSTVSIGIALSAAHYTQPEHLMRDADTAMYRAKALGKARCQVFDRTMHTRMVTRLQLENDLRRAISQEQRYTLDEVDAIPHELSLHYQPIVCLETGEIYGFEALTRWRHPDYGFLSPAKFIPMAEETGLIIPLGWWILRQACRQMCNWQGLLQEDTQLTLNVNLASKQFSLPDLIEQSNYILHETGVDSSRIKLEITEGTIMENAKSVVSMLHQLRSLGLQLAIDDFGTGYSSLSYLRRFPINTLKIDRSFVSRMHIDSDSAEIVRTIITLAHNLRLDVTAEGVETQEQADQLLEMGCEYGQGYLFAKPLTADAATELLIERLNLKPS